MKRFLSLLAGGMLLVASANAFAQAPASRTFHVGSVILDDDGGNTVLIQVPAGGTNVSMSQPLNPASGGTGLTTITPGSLLMGNGTANVTLFVGVAGDLNKTLVWDNALNAGAGGWAFSTAALGNMAYQSSSALTLTDLHFAQGANHTIDINPHTSAAGNNLTVAAGNGFTNFNGGNLILNAGAGAGTGVSGNVGITGTTISLTGAVTSSTGYQIGGAAASGNYLRGNGTNFVSAGLDVSDASAGTLAVGRGGTGQTTYTDGQLLIGKTTGNTLAKATLTGTTNQVTVTNGGGSITLSTPQDINAAATPTFASETLSATTNQLTLGTTNTTIISATAPLAPRVYTLPDAGANTSFILGAAGAAGQAISGGNGTNGALNLTNGTVGNPIATLSDGTNTTSLKVSSANVTVTLPATTGTLLNDNTGVQLQATTPGTVQTGNLNISGTTKTGNLTVTGTATLPAGAVSVGSLALAQNNLIVGDATGFGSALASANNAVLVTSATGLPSLSTALPPIGVGIAAGSSYMLNIDAATAGKSGTYVKGLDVNGISIPTEINGNTTALTFGFVGGNTQGRMLRVKDLATPTIWYDMGIDAGSNFYLMATDNKKLTLSNAGLTTLPGSLVLTNGANTTTISAVSGSNVSFSMPSTGIAGAGANSDITSLSGLTTALSVAQGGTGNNAASVAGGVVYGVSTTQLATTSAGTAGNVLISGGAGAPSFTGTPTLTSLTAPSLIGSTAANGTLTLTASSNIANTGTAMLFKVGNSGATTAMTINHDGSVAIPTLSVTSNFGGNFTFTGDVAHSFGIAQNTVTNPGQILTISGGNAKVGGAAAGGNVIINGGAGDGAGATGNVILNNTGGSTLLQGTTAFQGKVTYTHTDVTAGAVVDLSAVTALVVRITDDAAVAANAITAPASPVDGQLLFISNQDAQTTSGAFAIASNSSATFVYFGTPAFAWVRIAN